MASEDIDPVYPVLRALYAAQGWAEAQALWFTTLYVAFYHLGSAWVAFQERPDPGPLPARVTRLAIAVERRGLRGGKVLAHVEALVATTGSDLAGFIRDGWRTHPEANYEAFWIQWQRVWGNGRWATFKMAELLKKVHGLPLAAPDMRLADCSGPRQGLEWLYGLHGEDVPTLDRAGVQLRGMLAAAGLALDWEGVETVLCNFNSTAKGHYYVGHDIDEMQGQLTQAPSDVTPLWTARAAALPVAYRGEAHGWCGVNPSFQRWYRDHGTILTRG